VRTQAALILAEKTKHQNPAALLGLFEALDEDDFDTCQQSLRSINGTFQENPSSVTPERIEELINFLGKSRFPSDRNMDNDIRWTTEDVLIAHCDKSFPYLITAIRHDSASAKLAVLEAIWIIAENRVIPREQILDAVPALIEALNDGYQGVMPREGRYVSVKNLAQEALVKISPLEILQEYLKNERTWLHPHVKKVIEQIQSTNTQNTN
jgi:hypothetical protein